MKESFAIRARCSVRVNADCTYRRLAACFRCDWGAYDNCHLGLLGKVPEWEEYSVFWIDDASCKKAQFVARQGKLGKEQERDRLFGRQADEREVLRDVCADILRN